MTIKENFPILEFSGEGPAVIEPKAIYGKKDRIPDRCVLAFFKNVVDEMAQKGRIQLLCKLYGEGDPVKVFKIKRLEKEVALVFPGVGAPYAACTLEELISLGGKRFVFCGGAGVLRKDLARGTVIVPTQALRCEGTSYHYQQKGRFCTPAPQALEAILETLKKGTIPFETGKTWTTDAVFRETESMVQRRRQEGCLTVEMEASALFAVARFREVQLAGMLYGGDDVSGEIWDSRGWMSLSELRAALVDLAVEAVCRMRI